MITEHDVHIEPGVVTTLRFNRPQKKNAITAAMYTALADGLEAAANDPEVRVVLILGAGGAFTAGNDLKDFLANPPKGEDAPVFRVLEGLRQFPKPLVAAVDGVAVGIGTTMLLHCDLVYCSDRARFQLPFINLGLTPEGGASYLLPRAVGRQRASSWLFFGEPISPAEALEAGIVNAVLPPDDLEAFARARCEVLATKSPSGLAAAKALMRVNEQEDLRVAMVREAGEIVTRLESPEAIAAFTRFLAPKS